MPRRPTQSRHRPPTGPGHHVPFRHPWGQGAGPEVSVRIQPKLDPRTAWNLPRLCLLLGCLLREIGWAGALTLRGSHHLRQSPFLSPESSELRRWLPGGAKEGRPGLAAPPDFRGQRAKPGEWPLQGSAWLDQASSQLDMCQSRPQGLAHLAGLPKRQLPLLPRRTKARGHRAATKPGRGVSDPRNHFGRVSW